MTTHWSAHPVDVVHAEEEPVVSGGDGGGQPADVARLRRDAEVEVLHHPKNVVHHDCDVERRATADVALGLHVRDERAEDADEVDVVDPAAWWRVSLLMSREIATVRVNARLGLVDEEELAGSRADGRRGGARGGGCRVGAGEV